MNNEEQSEKLDVGQDVEQGEKPREGYNEKPQVFIDIAADEMRQRVEEYSELGWRFVNICGSTVVDAADAASAASAGDGGAGAAGAASSAASSAEGGGATGVELIYSFSKGLPLENLRFTIDTGTVVPSISDCFPNAFFFENETHDLFGVKFSGISIDFDGEFYTVAVPTPMNPYSSAAREAAATLKAQETPQAHKEVH
jgi:NADH:ubiquinone oxidoreductase subunit C